MLKSHERFYSANGKRRLLVVDDEAVNRELLRIMLEEHFDLLFAENGREALTMMRDNAQRLSLVLLDLMMPEMDGFTLLEIAKKDDILRRIPIIVLTSERDAEVKSLRLGAQDFIKKPYDLPEVILARIQRVIELSEDSDIIQKTERDELSGVLNTEFFYRYVEQFDLHHPGLEMDAISIDINRFRMVNELYGRAMGDEVLRRIGARLIDIIGRIGGIAGRKGGDEFLLYCPHGVKPETIREMVLADFAEDEVLAKIRVRMGIYPEADTTMEPERRFDRAKEAADTVRDSFTSPIAFYDNRLHERDVLAERLIDSMDEALATGQFKVFYQPKYNVQGEKPTLCSAEALIRWKHPELGMISPGVFIPLFEKNGLIQKLDRWVWAEAMAQIRCWREKYGVTIPVSVNVSRIDLFAPDFMDCLEALLTENRLNARDCYLEITESAYTNDSAQLIDVVKELRRRGYYIEMDDFGSGYSSLNMLSMLPIDALKLDMQFVRNMEADERSARMLELMIDIAKYLGVPVIAEGVETAAQVEALRRMGCDMIQGYYFSRPIPPEEFEKRIEEKIESC